MDRDARKGLIEVRTRIHEYLRITLLPGACRQVRVRLNWQPQGNIASTNMQGGSSRVACSEATRSSHRRCCYWSSKRSLAARSLRGTKSAFY